MYNILQRYVILRLFITYFFFRYNWWRIRFLVVYTLLCLVWIVFILMLLMLIFRLRWFMLHLFLILLWLRLGFLKIYHRIYFQIECRECPVRHRQRVHHLICIIVQEDIFLFILFYSFLFVRIGILFLLLCFLFVALRRHCHNMIFHYAADLCWVYLKFYYIFLYMQLSYVCMYMLLFKKNFYACIYPMYAFLCVIVFTGLFVLYNKTYKPVFSILVLFCYRYSWLLANISC